MLRMATQYASDVGQYICLGPLGWFQFVAAIPYSPDPKGLEYVQRPWHSLHGNGRGRDCDDKAVLMAAWAHLCGIPFRFIAAARNKGQRLHHTWCEYWMDGRWVTMDATYPWSVPGWNGTWAHKVVLK